MGKGGEADLGVGEKALKSKDGKWLVVGRFRSLGVKDRGAIDWHLGEGISRRFQRWRALDSCNGTNCTIFENNKGWAG